MTDFRVIETSGPQFADWIQLRQAVLRAPLGLVLSAADTASDFEHHHLGAFEDHHLIAGLILVPVLDDRGVTLRMRQVAVSPECQRRGIGSRLVRFSETFARECGAEWMTLHARENAVPFYEQLDYRLEGEPFEEVGLPHRTMWKRLDPIHAKNPVD